MILHSSLCIGGAERVIAHLAGNLDPERFDIHIGYLKEKGEIGDEMAADGFKVVKIDAPKIPKGGLFNFLSLRRYLRQNRIRLIHSHGTAALASAAACRLVTPGIRQLHTYHFGNYPHQKPSNKRLESLFWRVPDRLIAVGRRQMEAIRSTYGIPEERIITVYNGVDRLEPKVDDSLLRPYRATGKVLIGSISTMIEQKGIPDLLQVAFELKKRTDNALFLVVGDGRLRQEMETRRDALGLEDTVHFLGWVKNAAATVLPALDVFLQTSLWEAMSMVILEAMSAGRAIVATDVGDNRYMLQDGVSGHVVQPTDVGAMTEILERLCADPGARAALGEAATRDHRTRFTVASMADRYADQYLELADG